MNFLEAIKSGSYEIRTLRDNQPVKVIGRCTHKGEPSLQVEFLNQQGTGWQKGWCTMDGHYKKDTPFFTLRKMRQVVTNLKIGWKAEFEKPSGRSYVAFYNGTVELASAIQHNKSQLVKVMRIREG